MLHTTQEKNTLYSIGHENFTKFIKNIGLPIIIVSVLLLINFVVTIADGNNYIPKSSKAKSDKHSGRTNFITQQITFEQKGRCSWYHNMFHNRSTSNGERYSKFKHTAAHRSLPFGSIVKITNTINNQVTFVRVNDRGPFVRSKIIDLSKLAASSINGLGNPHVKIQTLLSQNYFDSEEDASNYFLVYSYSHDPICLPASEFSVLIKCNNFEHAVEEFAKVNKYHTEYDCYLLVTPTVAQNREDDSEDGEEYFIGCKRGDVEMTYSDLIFNK